MNNSTLYNKLYNEFAPAWGFHIGRLNINDFVFVLSNDVFKLFQVVKDRRFSNGITFKTLLKTGDADEMRHFLTNNTPNK